MGFSFSEITFILSAISSAAVIAGAFFIVFQLRQNALLIRATLAQNRNDAAFNIMERMTSLETAHRRKQVRDVVAKYSKDGWDAYFETMDDFEIRSFALQYTLTGQFVREGIIDLELVTHMMSYMIVTDWLAFRPIAEYLDFRFQAKPSPWIHFQWLADKCREHLESEVHARHAPELGA
jgi:hypothetical protein